MASTSDTTGKNEAGALREATNKGMSDPIQSGVATRFDPFAQNFYSKTQAERDQFLKELQTGENAERLQKTGGIIPYTDATATAEQLAWRKRREDETDLYHFESWLSSIFDPRDPNMSRLIKEMYPAYFEGREALIDKQADLQKKAAKISLLGPQSKEDLFFLYNVQLGRVQIPAHALHMPEDTYKDMARGYLNPHKSKVKDARDAPSMREEAKSMQWTGFLPGGKPKPGSSIPLAMNMDYQGRPFNTATTWPVQWRGN
jgi:hypothetical protein